MTTIKAGVLAAVAAGLVVLAGCSPETKTQGKQDTTATYRGMNLRANLPTRIAKCNGDSRG